MKDNPPPPDKPVESEVDTPTTFEPEMSEEVAVRTGTLRSGWTTGTCASAAAKAAAWSLQNGVSPDEIEVAIPNGKLVTFPVVSLGPGSAGVVKDAGDDPDCTDGAMLCARAVWQNDLVKYPNPQSPACVEAGAGVMLVRGDGVGLITKPGLGLEIGTPAINPVPRRMIHQAVRQVTDRAIQIEISVPGGEEMAQQTTNERLGIIGGISILGTTGVVKPFSTAAYRASVVQQIDVASAQAERTLVLSTGYRSEKCAMGILADLDPVCFVEVGDFTGIALRRAAVKGFDKVYFVGMAGKIAKLAAGVMMTHYNRSKVDTQLIERSAIESGASKRLVEAATHTETARHFFEMCMVEDNKAPLELLCRWARNSCLTHSKSNMEIIIWMVDYEGVEVAARA